jgi:hypothetical protein
MATNINIQTNQRNGRNAVRLNDIKNMAIDREGVGRECRDVDDTKTAELRRGILTEHWCCSPIAVALRLNITNGYTITRDTHRFPCTTLITDHGTAGPPLYL